MFSIELTLQLIEAIQSAMTAIFLSDTYSTHHHTEFLWAAFCTGNPDKIQGEINDFAAEEEEAEWQAECDDAYDRRYNDYD
jgi:hypothetical protein